MGGRGEGCGVRGDRQRTRVPTLCFRPCGAELATARRGEAPWCVVSGELSAAQRLRLIRHERLEPLAARRRPTLAQNAQPDDPTGEEQKERDQSTRGALAPRTVDERHQRLGECNRRASNGGPRSRFGEREGRERRRGEARRGERARRGFEALHADSSPHSSAKVSEPAAVVVFLTGHVSSYQRAHVFPLRSRLLWTRFGTQYRESAHQPQKRVLAGC